MHRKIASKNKTSQHSKTGPSELSELCKSGFTVVTPFSKEYRLTLTLMGQFIPVNAHKIVLRVTIDRGRIFH